MRHRVGVDIICNSINRTFYNDVVAGCYEPYGCFSVARPWTSSIRPINNFPENPETIQPVLCLFTRNNRSRCNVLFKSVHFCFLWRFFDKKCSTPFFFFFSFFIRCGTHKKSLVTGDVTSLHRSGLNASRKVLFICHGYLEHGNKKWIKVCVGAHINLHWNL